MWKVSFFKTSDRKIIFPVEFAFHEPRHIPFRAKAWKSLQISSDKVKRKQVKAMRVPLIWSALIFLEEYKSNCIYYIDIYIVASVYITLEKKRNWLIKLQDHKLKKKFMKKKYISTIRYYITVPFYINECSMDQHFF